MTYWDRLEKYRRQGPQAAGKLELRPAEEFRGVVGDLFDSRLQPLGWSRSRGLQWKRQGTQAWAEEVVDLQSLKNGVGIRWGLRLSFVPRLDEQKRPRPLDWSYDPFDYERNPSGWTFSRFATDEELRLQADEVMPRVIPELRSMSECARDLVALASCFEAKRNRRHVRLGFHQYPQEGTAYAAVLGLIGREAEGLEILAAVCERLELPGPDRERLELVMRDLWRSGPP